MRWHWAGVLWIFFFPSLFTQWQCAEVLWGLGANELTLQRWGRCSVTQGVGESEDNAIRDALGWRQSLDRAVETWPNETCASKVVLFSQSGSIIQHVTEYLVNSVCLNFQETQPNGSGERQALTTVESWDVPLHVAQRGCAGPSFSVSYLHFPFFYSVLLDCTTKWFYQQRVNWTVFSREGHLKCQVFLDELITSCGTRVCGVNMCWSPPRPCEWSEKNLTSFLGLRRDHF